MRIFTDFNPFRFILAVILLAVQFGCASVQKPPYYYNPPEKVDKIIERPNVSVCTPRDFDIKLDEVRKKTKFFIEKGSSSDSLLATVAANSFTTKEIYEEVEKRHRRCALIGGLSVGIGCLAFIETRQEEQADQIIITIAAPILALIAGFMGALTGSAVAGVSVEKKLNEPLPVEKVRPLDSLVVRYNTCIAEQGEAQP